MTCKMLVEELHRNIWLVFWLSVAVHIFLGFFIPLTRDFFKALHNSFREKPQNEIKTMNEAIAGADMELISSATMSIEQLNNYGLVGTLLAILILFAGFAIWYLANHCEKRTDAAINAYKEESATNRQVIEKNTAGFHSLELTLAKMDARMDK